ncbi:MAG: c-type cytochrome [Proteobacteria bacterium]|nr:c-type cytochrome [Pseudomonadota bacterium]
MKRLTVLLSLGLGLGLMAAPSAFAQGRCDAAARQRGTQLFEARCAICHSADHKAGHQFGPNLAGVLGRPVGKVKGFEFSKPMGDAGGAWDAASLQAFLEAPSVVYPGTAMAFGGMAAADERAAVACFLSGRK